MIKIDNYYLKRLDGDDSEPTSRAGGSSMQQKLPLLSIDAWNGPEMLT